MRTCTRAAGVRLNATCLDQADGVCDLLSLWCGGLDNRPWTDDLLSWGNPNTTHRQNPPSSVRSCKGKNSSKLASRYLLRQYQPLCEDRRQALRILCNVDALLHNLQARIVVRKRDAPIHSTQWSINFCYPQTNLLASCGSRENVFWRSQTVHRNWCL